MKLGTTLDSIWAGVQMRQTNRTEVVEGGEELLALVAEDSEDLNTQEGDGNDQQTFVFGLHNPFDPINLRLFKVG